MGVGGWESGFGNIDSSLDRNLGLKYFWDMIHGADGRLESERQAARRSDRKIFIGFYAILAGYIIYHLLFPYIFGVRVRFDPNKKPDFDVRNPDSIELQILGGAPVVFAVTNTAEMMSLLREGRHAATHKCSYRGQLTLHYANGTNVSIDIRPGHTNTSYEFSHGGIFKFSRSEFMAILASEGIDTNQIPMK